MNKQKDITEVEILGESYRILNNAPPEHTQTLAKYVDEKMKEISQSSSAVSSLKIAVLTALNIADELFKEKKELETEKEMIALETENLFRLINDNIKR